MSDPVSTDQDAAPAVVVAPGPDPAVEPGGGPPSEADPELPAGPVQLRLRRAPRYLPFGLTGALIGVIAGVVLALSFSATSDYSIQTIAGYFAAILGLIGALAALTLAVLLERRRRHQISPS